MKNTRSSGKTLGLAPLIVPIGRKVCFHRTLPFMTKQRSQFGCGYLQTSQEVTESLILNRKHSRTSLKHANSIVFAIFVQ